MRSYTKLSCLLAFLFFALFGVLNTANAEQYTSNSFQILDPVISAGAGYVTSNSFINQQSLGEPSLGRSTSNNFQLNPDSIIRQIAVTLKEKVVDLVKKIFPGSLAGDLNKDNRVNLQDVSILLYAWQKRLDREDHKQFFASIIEFNYASPDINNNKIVNLVDLSILLSNWTE